MKALPRRELRLSLVRLTLRVVYCLDRGHTGAAMAGALSRVGGWWKAAAGCAICASLVAGVIDDTRHWIWDRTVGFVFPVQASFDTCLSRQIDGLKRPEGALYQVIVTVPLGDTGQTAFRQIETSLTRAYGETEEAAIRVGALDCEALKPTAGDSAQRLATAQARADALLAGTGADAVLWGEVFADGRTMELRFAHPQSEGVGVDKAAVYEAGAITLDLNFGQDIGQLIAARALDTTTAVSGGFRLDQGAVAAQIHVLLAPLVAARPAGIDDADYAAVLLSEGLAAGTAAMASGDAAALLAVADRLKTAGALFPPEAVSLQDFSRVAAAFYRGNAASLLPAAEARAALEESARELKALGHRIGTLFGLNEAIALNSDLGLAMALAAPLMSEPERNEWMREGIARLREASVALPEPALLLQFGLGINARIALSEGDEEIALNVEATSVVDRALAGLPEGDRGLIWLRATTLKSMLMLGRVQMSMTADPAALLDEAIALLTPVVEVARNSPAAVDRAKAEATLGWILVFRAYHEQDGVDVARLVERAEAALRGALSVYGPTSSPLLWGWTLEGLAFASVVCVTDPNCADLAASRSEARARFVEAAEAYRVAGQDQQVARTMAMSEKYGAAP